MRVKLEDVCERGSSNLKQSDVAGESGDYPIFGAAGYIGNVDFYHQEKPYIAVVKDGAGIGRTSLLPEKSSVIGTMQYLLPKDNVLPEYLCYVVRYMHLEKYFSGATIPHIYFRDYKNEEFNLDNLDRQQEIVSTLGRIETIIDARKEEVSKLEELIKARFVEMFGSIKTNDKGWNTARLKNIADVRGRVGWKGYKKEDLRKSGPIVLGATHLTDNGDLDLSAPVYLSREKYEESPEIVLQKNDLIFTQRGNTIGKVGLVAEDIGEATINPCVLILRPLKIHPVYFKTYFLMDETKDDMWMLNSGSAQPMITQKGIGEYLLMTPPIQLQEKFGDFVAQVDKSKVVIQKALDETQLLFDSLMQQYFG